ncbi:MAG: hypothetical protein R3E66_24310, partial [bacterium]
GQMTMTLSILPIRDDFWLCDTHAGVVPHSPLGAPFSRADFPAVWAWNQREIAWHEDRVVVIRQLVDGSETRVPLPDSVERLHCMTMNDAWIFTGANANTTQARVLAISLQHRDRFDEIGPPGVVGDPNKPVITVECWRDLLVAVDTGFAPRLLHVFRADHSPELLHSVRIPSGVDDHVHGLAFGRAYMFAASATNHKDAKAWKIGVYDTRGFDEISTFFHRVPWEAAFDPPLHLWAEDDLLLIAHGALGLGVVRLDDGQATKHANIRAVQPWSRPYIGIDNITYRSSFQTGRVVRIHGVIPGQGALVTLNHGSKQWWEIIAIN